MPWRNTSGDEMLARYEKAAALLPHQIEGLMRNRLVEPVWTGEGDCFWYRRDRDEAGHELVHVDPATAERRTLSEAEVTALLRPVSGDPAITSPDGKKALFRNGPDLWIRDLVVGEERCLLGGGEAGFAWGALPDNNMVHVPLSRAPQGLPPVFTGFSPSGRWVVSARVDERDLRGWPLVEHLPPEGVRPLLHSIRVQLEGEAADSSSELAFVDLATQRTTVIAVAPAVLAAFVRTGMDALAWSPDESAVYVFVHSPGDATGRLLEIDVTTGADRVVVSETAEPIYEPNTFLYSLPLIRVLSASREVVWFSQRDGWGHLYLYDLDSGECIRQITSGELVVRDLLHVDDSRREVLFLAGSGSDGHNPYWRKLYRASLDATGQELLTPEACDHEVLAPAPQFFSIIFDSGRPPAAAVSPSGRYVVDHMSTVSEPPHVVLRDTRAGRVVMTLERTDISTLLDAGYVMPQQFCVKADDGVTDLWGVLTVPPGLDEGERVPVIDLMYGGFQVAYQPPGFVGPELASRSAAACSSWAALGFATVVLDGRGTSGRDRVFRQWTQGRPETARGLEDHVTAIRSLAARHPELDVERVGVTGHSYGGYNSARSILLFPDFFRVAVSSAGVHVPERMPKGHWGWHVGADTPVDSPAYQALGNLHLVGALVGKLLLVFGELDENATLDHSLALADALMKAGKRFDMKLWPGLNHYQSTGYTVMAAWDYFVEHLLGRPLPPYVPPTGTSDRTSR